MRPRQHVLKPRPLQGCNSSSEVASLLHQLPGLDPSRFGQLSKMTISRESTLRIATYKSTMHLPQRAHLSSVQQIGARPVGLSKPHRPSRHTVTTQAAAQGSTFGQLFRVTTYGTSHGLGVGCIVDGCPPRLPITVEEIQLDLDRRRPGQSRITTPRKETDTCHIMSGVSSEGWTEGDPIHITVPNATQRSQDYKEMEVAYRPSHADATYDMKYGTRAIAGGGRASARETIGRVAAGAIAKKLLKQVCGTEVSMLLS